VTGKRDPEDASLHDRSSRAETPHLDISDARPSPVVDPMPGASTPDRTEHITRVLIVAQGEGGQD